MQDSSRTFPCPSCAVTSAVKVKKARVHCGNIRLKVIKLSVDKCQGFTFQESRAGGYTISRFHQRYTNKRAIEVLNAT